jgi:hypothetical protein
MRKYLLPALFLLFMALNGAIYAFIMLELNGSTVTTKRSVTQQELRRR